MVRCTIEKLFFFLYDHQIKADVRDAEERMGWDNIKHSQQTENEQQHCQQTALNFVGTQVLNLKVRFTFIYFTISSIVVTYSTFELSFTIFIFFSSLISSTSLLQVYKLMVLLCTLNILMTAYFINGVLFFVNHFNNRINFEVLSRTGHGVELKSRHFHKFVLY